MRFALEKLQELIADKPFLKTFVRNKKKQPVGVLVAVKYDKKVYIGWSKCNTKLDRFDRKFGFYLAVVRANKKLLTLKKHNAPLPTAVQKWLPKFVERAGKFFKQKID